MAEVKHTAKHPGFVEEAERISRRQGIPVERARAILAAGARNASARAVAANPRLKRVKRSTK